MANFKRSRFLLFEDGVAIGVFKKDSRETNLHHATILSCIISEYGDYVCISYEDQSFIHLTRYVPSRYSKQVFELLRFRNRYCAISKSFRCERFYPNSVAERTSSEVDGDDLLLPSASISSSFLSSTFTSTSSAPVSSENDGQSWTTISSLDGRAQIRHCPFSKRVALVSDALFSPDNALTLGAVSVASGGGSSSSNSNNEGAGGSTSPNLHSLRCVPSSVTIFPSGVAPAILLGVIQSKLYHQRGERDAAATSASSTTILLPQPQHYFVSKGVGSESDSGSLSGRARALFDELGAEVSLLNDLNNYPTGDKRVVLVESIDGAAVFVLQSQPDEDIEANPLVVDAWIQEEAELEGGEGGERNHVDDEEIYFVSSATVILSLQGDFLMLHSIDQETGAPSSFTMHIGLLANPEVEEEIEEEELVKHNKVVVDTVMIILQETYR